MQGFTSQIFFAFVSPRANAHMRKVNPTEVNLNMGYDCGVGLWSCKTLNVGRLTAVGRWKSVGAIGTIGSEHATFFGVCAPSRDIST